jgi:hypothetical protein
MVDPGADDTAASAKRPETRLNGRDYRLPVDNNPIDKYLEQ